MTGPAAFAGSERARQLLTALQERAYAATGTRPNVYHGVRRLGGGADGGGALLATSAMMRVKRLDGALSYWGSDFFLQRHGRHGPCGVAAADRRRGTPDARVAPAGGPAARLPAAVHAAGVGDEAGDRLVGMGELVERVVGALWTRTRPAVLAARAAAARRPAAGAPDATRGRRPGAAAHGQGSARKRATWQAPGQLSNGEEATVQGLMQDYPLTLPPVFDRAERLYGAKKIVWGTATGRERCTLGEWADRTRRIGGVLDALGVPADARVGTFAWNTADHLGLYWAAPCSGRVLHTLNIRLFPEQLTYIVNHAEDDVIFVDRSLLGLLWKLVPTFETVRHFIVMDDGAPTELPDDPRVLRLDDLLADAPPVRFSVADENAAAAMCYTSGTTGSPKGVVYSHRSLYLHSLSGTNAGGGLALSERDRALPVVPMFHANAWGFAHSPLFAGAELVLPGPQMAPEKIAAMLEEEKVTVTAGVPTIWMGMLPELDGRDLSSLRTILCGGSAVPKALSEAYRAKLGRPILHAWGMTETSPLGSINFMPSAYDGLSEDDLADVRARQGIPPVGVDARIVEPGTVTELPWDDKATGELQVRGPWIARAYYRDERSSESFTEDGWLRTGDVGAIDQYGNIRLSDRTKDLVKSGGEWISSVELENHLMGHPAVAEAAVIGVPHPRWQERPLAAVVLKPGETATRDELIDYLKPRVAKWWLPDDVVFIDEVPKTSVGKFSKKDLRSRFADYQLPSVDAEP